VSTEILKNLRFNFTVNLLDGAFFGFASGFTSYVTILPLFVSTLTDSPILIGLVPAIHAAGWQLPQLFTAGWISRQKHIKPLVVSLTALERFPYAGLALLAFLLPGLDPQVTLVIVFILLVIQGLGAGLTANPWSSMVGKIIPAERRGTFFGLQAGAANLLASVSAVFAGLLLSRFSGWAGFGWCFLLATIILLLSWIFIALTREPATIRPEPEEAPQATNSLANLRRILRENGNFRWFLAARLTSQLSLMGYAFYSIYAVNHLAVSKIQIGWMTGVLMGANVLANIGMGWIGDRWGHRSVMKAGLLSMSLSALFAWWAPSGGWFFLVFILAAIGNVATWTVALAMTLEFGTDEERPTYIGLANTLVAPANILVPFLGGWLASSSGYPTVFALSALGGLFAAFIFHRRVLDQPWRIGDAPAVEIPPAL
jgi:MFS family permease